MSNMLKQAARGLAGAAVGLADDALAELRARRMQEFQYSLGAGDRDRNYQLQKDGQDHQKAHQEKSLDMQAENMRADNKSREASIGLQREGLGLQQDNSEYSRVADAYSGAMAGVAGISARMAEIEKQQPKIGSDGQPLEDPKSFNDRKDQMLADLEAKLEVERERAKSQVDSLSKQFPQYQKYFVQPKPVQQEAAVPPLLRRPGAEAKYDPSAKPF